MTTDIEAIKTWKFLSEEHRDIAVDGPMVSGECLMK